MESGNKTSVHVLIRLGIWRTLKSAAFDLRKNWCKHYLRERERVLKINRTLYSLIVEWIFSRKVQLIEA